MSAPSVALALALALGPAAASASLAVDVLDFEYRDVGTGTPATLARAGDAITWTIVGGMHTVRDVAGAFASGVLFEGQSFTHVASEPGVISYYCEIHETMRGLVVVQP